MFEVQGEGGHSRLQESRVKREESLQIQAHKGLTTANLGVCCQIVCSSCKGQKFLFMQGDNNTNRMVGNVSFSCLWIFCSKPAPYISRVNQTLT